MTALDINLFAGAGGMALGLKAAGFSPGLLYEVDPYACLTLRTNELAVGPPLEDGIREVDVKTVDWQEVLELDLPVRLLAGGVPCQPFSLAGKHLADKDGRNLFPELLSAIRVLRPAAVLIENVHGLLRQSFQPYFEYILRRLESPSLAPKQSELWQDHDERLRRHQRASGYDPEYHVQWRLLDSANFGVPQNRRRVFIVAVRYDLPLYRFPARSHSRTKLEAEQASGAYWDRVGIKGPNGRQARVIANPHVDTFPWTTVREALASLPEPAECEESSRMNHWRILGARSYKGHTGSRLDWPSKTIKAGVHGVPGGENTVLNGRGELRYYTLREAARIQVFPDGHFFEGARMHVTRQIGNAIPSRLVEAVARPLYDLLKNDRSSGKTMKGAT